MFLSCAGHIHKKTDSTFFCLNKCLGENAKPYTVYCFFGNSKQVGIEANRTTTLNHRGAVNARTARSIAAKYAKMYRIDGFTVTSSKVGGHYRDIMVVEPSRIYPDYK